MPAYFLSHLKPFDQQTSSVPCSQQVLNSVTCEAVIGRIWKPAHALSPGFPQYLPSLLCLLLPKPVLSLVS